MSSQAWGDPKAVDFLRDSEVQRSLPRERDMNKPKPPQGSPLQTEPSLVPLVQQRDGDPTAPYIWGNTPAPWEGDLG